ncbi:MAG TPA: potassium channel family protein [Solirubrobacteraceae bacterium]|nr:potassium channel family protein [Solirubrobacteraceae bacterium]
MSLGYTLLLTVAGLVLIAMALRDIFDVLFHLEGRASISRALTRAVWRALRRAADVRPGLFPLAGPLGLVAVIAAWAVLLLVGWALLLWPHLASFRDVAGDPARGGLWEALHISAMTLSTLGYGDVTPVDQWLRVVAPLEALVGFGLLTASVAWLFAVQPAVQRRRALGYELWLLREAADGDHDAPVANGQMFTELTSRIVAVERDIVAIPASYYFRDPDERLLLSAQLPFLRVLTARASAGGEDAGTAQRAAMLRTAIDDLLLTIARRLHGRRGVDPDEALRMFARDHLKRDLRE